MKALVAKDLKKTYRQGATTIEAVRGVSLEVDSGETLAIVGSSGSGKSTLLAILSGLESPDSGTCTVADKDLYALKPESLTRFRARHIALVFQQFHLIQHLTALENVGVPLEILGGHSQKEIRTRAQDLLESVGLASRLNHLPSELSGGECQRVAIARALISNPSLILADEPSGSLDDTTAKVVMDLFFEHVATRKVTAVLVTHNEALAGRCSRMVRMQGGVL